MSQVWEYIFLKSSFLRAAAGNKFCLRERNAAKFFFSSNILSLLHFLSRYVRWCPWRNNLEEKIPAVESRYYPICEK